MAASASRLRLGFPPLTPSLEEQEKQAYRPHGGGHATRQSSPVRVLGCTGNFARELTTSSAVIRCPLCRWCPRERDYWCCTCGHSWNTFGTGGVCPTCLQQWKET